jgi:hypothetical protein
MRLEQLEKIYYENIDKEFDTYSLWIKDRTTKSESKTYLESELRWILRQREIFSRLRKKTHDYNNYHFSFEP